MRLNLDTSRCIGCKLCQLACAAEKEGVFQPSLARLKIDKSYDRWGIRAEVALCTLCLECVEACPTGAIEYKDGRLHFEREECTGCNACADACPQKVIVVKDDSVGICDSCGGSPQCVAWCPHQALSYGNVAEEVG